ncbi:unnamed protein product [Boreogadus saida]
MYNEGAVKASVRAALDRTPLRGVRGLFAILRGGLLQFDDCVCCRILTSSFHDWLDFMEKMMEGGTLCCPGTPMVESVSHEERRDGMTFDI